MTLRLTSAALAFSLFGCQVSAHMSAGGADQPETLPPATTASAASTATPTPAPTTSASGAPAAPSPATTEVPPTATTTAPADTAAPATAPPETPPPPAATTAEAPPAAAPGQTSNVRTSGDRILLPGNVVFESGKSVMSPTPENETVLQQLKLFLDENAKVTQVRIEGYTDNVGQAETNLRLSGERARAIKTWLVAKGVPAERVIAVGFGADKPIADNATAEGRAQNRRTEFKIAAVNGRPYRGVPLNGGGTEFQ